LSIWTNWLKSRTFWFSAINGSSNSKSVSVLPEAESLPTSCGWQQIWRKRVKAARTWMVLPLTAFGHRVHDLFAAAAQFGQVKFPLRLAQFAIAPLLDAVRQIARPLPA
jgi:hypothetical protein